MTMGERAKAISDLVRASLDLSRAESESNTTAAAEAWLRVLVSVAVLRRGGGWVQ